MPARLAYVKRQDRPVAAVQLRLETDGFTYRKWGDVQRCRAGDWLVDNDGDVYTVEAESFARTYRAVGPGVFRKVTPVWAERADAPGRIQTKEGFTEYAAGDFLVFNETDGGDGYAMDPATFERMYEPAR